MLRPLEKTNISFTTPVCGPTKDVLPTAVDVDSVDPVLRSLISPPVPTVFGNHILLAQVSQPILFGGLTSLSETVSPDLISVIRDFLFDALMEKGIFVKTPDPTIDVPSHENKESKGGQRFIQICKDAECVADLAGSMGLEAGLFATVAYLEPSKEFILVLNYVEVATAAITRKSVVTIAEADSIATDKIKRAVEELVASFHEKLHPSRLVESSINMSAGIRLGMESMDSSRAKSVGDSSELGRCSTPNPTCGYENYPTAPAVTDDQSVDTENEKFAHVTFYKIMEPYFETLYQDQNGYVGGIGASLGIFYGVASHSQIMGFSETGLLNFNIDAIPFGWKFPEQNLIIKSYVGLGFSGTVGTTQIPLSNELPYQSPGVMIGLRALMGAEWCLGEGAEVPQLCWSLRLGGQAQPNLFNRHIENEITYENYGVDGRLILDGGVGIKL